MAIAIGLLKMLLELLREKKSGVVDVASIGARARLFIEDGVLVYASEGIVEDTLGRILVRERVLREDQYVAALEWMIQRHSSGKEPRLGDVLVELGMLTEGQVHAALAAQVQQKVVRALGWTTAEPTLMESHGTLDVRARFPTPLEPLLVAALRAAEREQVTALFAQSIGRYPALLDDDGATRSELIVRINALELPPAERDFARSLDGSRSVAEILAAREKVDVSVVLASLLLLDCLDLHATAQLPRAIKPPRPSRRASRPSMSDALATKSSIRPPFANARERVRALIARLRAAREVKMAANRAMPIVSDADAFAFPVTRLHAETAFQLGKTLVRANRMAMALGELRRAAVLYPVAEYELWAAWAALRTEPTEARVSEARRAAERALQEDPRFGFAYFVLGHLVLREGHGARADGLFERARILEPGILAYRDVTFRRRRKEPSIPVPAALQAPPPPLPSTRPAAQKVPSVAPESVTKNVRAPRAAPEVAFAREPTPSRMDVRDSELTFHRPRAPTYALAGIGIVACAALVWVLGRPGEASTPRGDTMHEAPVPSSSAQSSSAIVADADADVVDAAPAPSDAGLDARSAPDAAAGAPVEELPWFAGVIDLPPEASGHRLYLDGKMIGVAATPIAPLKTGCGRRTFRVGSGGRDRDIDVPCRGHIFVPYP